MNETGAAIPTDPLATLVAPELQRQAARMAQDAFAQVFRMTLSEDDAGRHAGVASVEATLREWAAGDANEDARGLRLALLLAGLDQWGLAYCQAFGLVAIPGLSELVGALRTGLDPRQEARLHTQFAAIDHAEANAIDFKVELRRGIHLALWHAMIAGEDRDGAFRILRELGGMMVALTRVMPALGWRLVADALAHIQIRCLAKGLAVDGLAQETTQQLFAALARELPKEQRERIMAHATQAVLGWQQANRAKRD